MRTFSNDAPEFFVFQIEGTDETFKIPTAASMTNDQLDEFKATGEDYDKQKAWLRGYIGDVVGQLTPKTCAGIITAWAQDSKERGASPGESSALSES